MPCASILWPPAQTPIPSGSNNTSTTAVAGCAIAFAGQALAQEVLTVGWVKGFDKSEDAALFAVIERFEHQTKVTVDLSQYTVRDGSPNTAAGHCPAAPPSLYDGCV